MYDSEYDEHHEDYIHDNGDDDELYEADCYDRAYDMQDALS